ncbi:MAG: DUF3179 domain-containing (seleno)protein [Wenzhouxiangella sp.]
MTREISTHGILTLLAALPLLVSTGVTAMNTDDLAERGEREIVELHQFFQDWYRGEPEADFNRLDLALSDGFIIIMPDARILGRDIIMGAVRGQRDSDAQAELEIRDVRLHEVHENTAIFTYEEWQGRGGEPMRGRLSTVVFATDRQAPNDLVWLHVHETGLPEANTAAAQPERPRNPFDTDILNDTFGYGPDTPSLVNHDDLYQGCPARDCIPSIDDPKYVQSDEATFLGDDELIMGIDINGQQRAYPARIMDYHEIVNDTVAGQPIAVTWCPLCGSGVAFDPRIDGEVVEFGVAGVLHDSDLVMYDRKSDSLWQQITGQAIMGPRMGERLEVLPMTMTDWQTWRQAHPNTLVLSTDTGIDRDYGDSRRYDDYDQSERLAFPVSERDLTIHPKSVVFGFEIDGRKLAIFENKLAEESRIETSLGERSLVIERGADGSVLATDENDNIHPSIRLFWFAWYNFHPDTARIN